MRPLAPSLPPSQPPARAGFGGQTSAEGDRYNLVCTTFLWFLQGNILMFRVSPSSMLFLPKFFNKYFNKNFAGSRESLLPKQNFVVLGSICYFTINRFISELWHFGRRILHFIELLTNKNKDACWSDLFLSLEILQNCLLYHFCRSVVCKTVGTGRGLKPDPHLTGDCLRDWWSWRLTTGADKMWRVPEHAHPTHKIPPPTTVSRHQQST